MTAGKDAVKTFEQKAKTLLAQDGNFIPLDTKSQRLLKERLLSLVERIEEES